MSRSQEAIVAYCRERGLEDPLPGENGAYSLLFDDAIRITLSTPDRGHVLCRYDVGPVGEGADRSSNVTRNLRLSMALMAEQQAILSFDEQQDLLFLFSRLQIEPGEQESFSGRVDDFVDEVERYDELVKALV